MTRIMVLSIWLVTSFAFQFYVPVFANNFLLRGNPGKALYGYGLENISGIQPMTVDKCLAQCLSNCRCKSFQICDDHNHECQLCSSDKDQDAAAFRDTNGCTNYDFGDDRVIEVSAQHCSSGCMRTIDCCLTSNPCLNGGTCLSEEQNQKIRYRCLCPNGYYGERCQFCPSGTNYSEIQCENVIKSCRGYRDGDRVPGHYMIYDDNMNNYEVFCDFDKNSSATWTLIQYYTFNKFSFGNKPFTDDVPFNNYASPTWSEYRLSKSQMQSIEAESIAWRITCQYDEDHVAHRTDYLRVSLSEMSILTYDDHRCIKVDYIDVSGMRCTNCTVYIWQTPSVGLHFDPTADSSCSFIPTGAPDCCYFGCYLNVPDTQHRCTLSNIATTQTWIGG